MIQRLQSLYLLFGSLFAGLFLVIGDAWYALVGPAYPLAMLAATVLAGLTALVALVAVFFYKDRKQQRKVVLAAQWLDLAFVLVVAGCLGALVFGAGQAVPTEVYLVVLLPIVAYVFLRLARSGVEKDIALVRSMDRLR